MHPSNFEKEFKASVIYIHAELKSNQLTEGKHFFLQFRNHIIIKRKI